MAASAETSAEASANASAERRAAAVVSRLQIREGVDLLEREPVIEALLPHRGSTVDLAASEPITNLLLGQRPDGLTVDREVPAGVAATLIFLGSSLLLVTNDDDVAALLTANFERLAADLLVRDRVLGSALIAFDLHQCASCAWVPQAASAPKWTHSSAGRPV